MAAKLKHCKSFTLVLALEAAKFFYYVHSLIKGGRRIWLATLGALKLVKNKRVSQRRSAYHNKVAACVCFHFFRVLGARYIAVCNNGNFNRRLNLCDNIKICRRLVILVAGPAVNGYESRAIIL